MGALALDRGTMLIRMEIVRTLIEKCMTRVRGYIVATKYNDFTIAEYFRRQGAHIGKDCRIEIRGLGPEPYLIKIGNHCTIAPHVQLITHDGGTWLFTDEIPGLQKFGTIEILDNCFIGQSAIILSNVKIGPNSIVGAGSIVTKDVPANVIVAGNPAKIISSIYSYKEKVLETWKEQRPPGYFEELKEGSIYSAETIHKNKVKDYALLRKHLMKLLWKK